MPRGGAWLRISTVPSAARAAKLQKSATLKLPNAELRLKATVTPFSSTRVVPGSGTGMAPVLPLAFKSIQRLPF
jgi:hypothetical protein